MFETAIEDSKIIHFVRFIARRLLQIKEFIFNIFEGSVIFSFLAWIINRAENFLKNAIKNSRTFYFCCSIINISVNVKLSLEDSAFVEYFNKNLKRKAGSLFKNSIFFKTINGAKKNFYLIPVRIIGAVMAIAIVIGIVLAVIFRRPITPFSLSMLVFIFFFLIAALFSDLNTTDLIENSRVIRFIFRRSC